MEKRENDRTKEGNNGKKIMDREEKIGKYRGKWEIGKFSFTEKKIGTVAPPPPCVWSTPGPLTVKSLKM